MMLMTRRTMMMLVVAVLMFGVGGFPSSGASVTRGNKPCDSVPTKAVRQAFETKFQSVTNGRGPLKSTCTFLATVVDPCILSVQVSVTVKPYKSKTAAATAYQALAAANQPLPALSSANTTEPLTREDVPGIGDGAYYSNGSGGSLVVLDGRRVLGFAGGLGVSDQRPGLCASADEVRADNRARLTRLATRVTT